jgi:hypothetical protein
VNEDYVEILRRRVNEKALKNVKPVKIEKKK